jgi:hypothetical protein
MAKIYPDTNRFIDFYQAALDAIDVFDDLQKYAGNLVLTQQTVVEFRRNRGKTLKWLAAQLKKTIDINSPYTTTILQAVPGHRELTDACKAYRRAGMEVVNRLGEMTGAEETDPIAQKFLALVNNPVVLNLPLTDGAFALARKRKLLGNPPTSPDKYTIGDEVIWELLIGNLKDDLIIVTKDHTYYENLPLLQEEFQQRTGHQLRLVTENFSEALKALGEIPSAELIEAETQESRRPDIALADTDPLFPWGQPVSQNLVPFEEGRSRSFYATTHARIFGDAFPDVFDQEFDRLIPEIPEHELADVKQGVEIVKTSGLRPNPMVLMNMPSHVTKWLYRVARSAQEISNNRRREAISRRSPPTPGAATGTPS